MPRRLGGALSAGLRRGFAVLAMLAALFALPAAAFETTAPTAILVDYGTGRVLYEKDADTEIPPASLAKLMTIAVLFDDHTTLFYHVDSELTLEGLAILADRHIS